MIKTINLQKIFKTEEVETWALNNVSIEVKQGEFVAIMGPSGCGKHTGIRSWICYQLSLIECLHGIQRIGRTNLKQP